MKGDKLQAIGLLMLRIGLGGVLIYYGLQHAFGMFGGHGFQGTLDIMQAGFHAPKWLGALAIISEFLGSIGVILGLFTRVAAFGIMCTMAEAVYGGATRLGVMRGLWDGDPTSPPAVLYPLAMMFMAMAVLLIGAGPLSLDRKIFKGGKK